MSCWIWLFIFFSLNIFADFPHYKKIKKEEIKRIEKLKSGGGYLDPFFTNHIKKEDVHSVLEIGSRDALDALKLSEFYKCHVYAFECNPESIKICSANIKTNPNVTLVPYAAWNQTEPISFYPIREVKGVFYNPGASSCYRVSKQGAHKTYAQNEIRVDAIRLDDWLSMNAISKVDLLCIDAQGATMNILEGLGAYLKNVKYIIAELEHKPMYEGEVLRDTADQFLESQGFRMYVGQVNRHFGDYLYVRKEIISAWWGVPEE